MAGYSTADSPVSRPYSAPGQYPGAGRTAALHVGITGDDPENAASSLNVGAEKWNQPWTFRPMSILTPIGRNPGGLGLSAGDAGRRWADGSPMATMGSPAGTTNGNTQAGVESAALLRATGQNY